MRSAMELARAGFLRERQGNARRQRCGGLPPPWSTTTIRVGTDCSGLDAPIWALRQLGIPHAHAFSCDCWRPARSIIALNSQPAGPLFSDMIGRPLDAVPQHDVYVCGFPCQPFSTLNNHSSFFRAAKAKPLKALVKTVLARSPSLVVLENVPGIMRKKAGLQRVLRRMHAHCFFLITLDPQMFGMPVRRPRVYMLGVRWDARAMATSTAMTELLQCMLAAITRSVTARATDFLLPSTHSLVRQSLEKSQQARRQAKSTGRRWLHRHAVARAAVQRHAPVRRLVPAPSVPGSLRMCSQREQDAWRLATERWGNRDFAVDLSQNADRVRGSVDGTCPTVTPGGQLFIQSLGRKITATEKLLLQAFPLHKMKKPQTISEHSLSKLAGNSMNLHCIGAALLLGMGLLDLTAASSAVAGQESRGPGLVLVCAPPKGGLSPPMGEGSQPPKQPVRKRPAANGGTANTRPCRGSGLAQLF